MVNFQGIFRNRSVWFFAKLILVTVLLGSLFMGFYILPARATTTTVYASYDNVLMTSNFVNLGCEDIVYSNIELVVGYSWGHWITGIFEYDMDDGYRSAIKFDLDDYNGKTINQATLKLWPIQSELPSDRNTQYAVNAYATNWYPATITWNTQPNYWPSGEARVNPPSSAAVPVEFDVTTIVQNWADGSWDNCGFMLRDINEDKPDYDCRRWTGFESLEVYSSLNHRPQLYLEYVGELPKVATPTFSPLSGALITNTLDVTIGCTTPSPTIRYTTDGSTPSSSHGTIYSGTFTISTSMTIKAIAYKSGYTDSNVATATYTKWNPTPLVATPTFSPPSGTYDSAQSVTIGCTTPSPTIRYTTDGSTPSSSHGTIYSGAISVGSSMTLKAIAYKSGYTDSNVVTATYTINIPSDDTPPGTPTVSSSTHPSHDVWYSNNDPSFTWTTPADASGIAGYSIGINQYSFAVPDEIVDTTANAFSYSDVEDREWYFHVRALDGAGNWGSRASYRFRVDTVAPTGSILINGGATSTSTASVTLTLTYTDATSGVDKVRYTNNDAWGSEPWEDPAATKSWTLDPNHVGGHWHVSYQIRDKAGLISDTVWDSISYVPGKVATPTFSPPSGTYDSAQSVTIGCTTPSPTIRYTTDGSTPSSSHGTIYSGAISVGSSMTLKAIAYKSGYTDSNVVTATYTIADVNELSFPVNVNDIDYFVGTRSSSSVYGLSFNQALKRLRFSVNGPDGTKGFCDITIPAELMSGDFSLYIDNVELVEGVDYTKTFNGVNYLFNVNYDHSSHVIDVFSTNVIPDFAAWLFLPFLMLATLLGFALRKRLKKNLNPILT